jgi:hypothetical protein
VEVRRALDLPLQELVYAGLDALAAVTDLDVCAYLHDSPSTGPQLVLGTPSLDATKGPQAFGLLADLSAALERAHGDDGPSATVVEEDVAGIPCLTVTTVGPDGCGVHALGRRSPALPPATRDALVRLAKALGAALHRLQWAGGSASS